MKLKFIFILLCCLSFLFSGCNKDDDKDNIVFAPTNDSTGVAGLCSNIWPMPGHDNRRTGCSPYIAIDDPGLKWSYDVTQGAYHMSSASSPTIGEDGVLYCYGFVTLYAVNADGTLKWECDLGSYPHEPPVIDKDGNLYIGTHDQNNLGQTQGTFYSVDKDGQIRWSISTHDKYDGGVFGSAAINPDGIIYFFDKEGRLYAVNNQGNILWTYVTDHGGYDSPSLGRDGTIYTGCGYYGSNEGKFYAINPSGKKIWDYSLNSCVVGGAAVDTNGNIYFSTEDHKLYSLLPDGTLNWIFENADESISAPAIDPQGRIVFTCYSGKVFSVNQNGTQNWVYETENELTTQPPAIDAYGTVIFVHPAQSKVIAVNSRGLFEWEYNSDNMHDRTPTIGLDGTIYLGSISRRLYALGSR